MATTVAEQSHKQQSCASLMPMPSSRTSRFHIESLVLENFKSFRGRYEIRGFSKITAIIGPNGAGKSNLMDAISFVLGTQPRSMRGRVLTDLIYRPANTVAPEESLFGTQLLDSAAEDGPPKEASVTLLLRATDGTAESLELERRIIATGVSGRSIFRVDGKTVNLEAYQRRMADLNMLLRAKNFLVFQGDVVEVAQKSEAELGRLFEQISGSENLKERYSHLETESQRLASELKYQTLQRQRIEDQRRDLEKQVDEINDYRNLESRLAETRTKLAVYRLYGNETVAARTKENLQESETEAVTLEAQQHTLTDKLRELDRNSTKLRLQIQQAEKQRREFESSISSSTNEIAELSEQVSFLQRQISQTEQQQRKEMVVAEAKNQQKTNLESTLESLETEIRAVAAEEESARANPVPLADTERAEYQTMKQQAASRTAALKSTAMALESKESLLKSRASLSESEVKDVGSRIERLDTEIEEVQNFINTSVPELEVLQTELSDFEAQFAEETSKFGEAVEHEKALIEQRAKLESELNIVGGNINDSHHTVKTQRLILELQDAFPGQVFGTVVGLCRPTNRKLAVAVTAALGKYLECVVVATFETAKKAVAYLKQRKSGVLELAALDSLSNTSTDSRRRELVSNNCRPAIDCIDFDPRFERVYEMALGDTLIVDTLEIAERLAFNDHRGIGASFKFVTLDGEKILKNGNFTVDASKSNRNRGSMFDAAEATRLTAMLREIEEALRTGNTSSQLQTSLSNMQAALSAKRTAVSSRAAKLSVWKDRLHRLEGERLEAAQLLDRLQSEGASVDAQLQSCCAEIEQIQKQIQETEEDLLKSKKFRGRMANIAELILEEDRQKLASRKRLEKRQKLLTTQQKARWELQRVVAEMQTESSTALRNKIEMLRTRLESVSRDTLRKKNAQEMQQASLMASTATLAAATNAQEKVEEEIATVQVETKQTRIKYRSVETKVQKLKNDSEHLVNQATELLKATIVNGITLPLKSGSMESICRLLGLQGDNSNRENDLGADVEMEPRTQDSLPEIDYDSVLTDELKRAVENPQTQRATECQLEEELGSQVNLLSRRTPNFKAKEKHAGVLQDLETLEETIRSTRLEKEAKEREFHSVCKERSRLFLACFHHVQKAIHDTYGKLTTTHNRVAGEAYLELSNDSGNDRAFCSDVLYHVIPPFKRFSDLKRLSGGEKTMAALALLFALQSYYPAPFFVMDEIDADLDPINVTSLARFLRSVEVQVVIISHADRVFSQADSLIGVYIDPMRESSGVLTLDLAQYPRAALQLHHRDDYGDSPSDHEGDFGDAGPEIEGRWSKPPLLHDTDDVAPYLSAPSTPHPLSNH